MTPIARQKLRHAIQSRLYRAAIIGLAPLALLASGLPSAAERPSPLVIARQGYFFVGGRYFDNSVGTFMSGQMYVEFEIPARLTKPYPIVMFAGGGQSGLNYSATADGRPGMRDFFLRRGYAVYLLDPPSRARSPHQPEIGEMSRYFTTDTVQRRFTAPERYGLWPQARLHTQWPGRGVAGDPIFDQFFAQVFPSLASFSKQQELNRDAGVALLDKIGPAILMTHSQSGVFGWLIADARPKLVKAIIAMEPSGPPVYENVAIGAPNWFKDGELGKPYGLTSQPLIYDPPIVQASDLKFIRQQKPDAPDLVRCWEQASPARKLANLTSISVLVIQAEASYHASYDHCTVDYLRAAGVTTTFIRLADVGIRGNGHMLMMEKNSDGIAAVASRWLDKTMAATRLRRAQ